MAEKIGALKMRSEKVSILEEILNRVKEADSCFILNYGGLKVDTLTELRKALSEKESHLMVVKNSLLGKVAKDQEWGDISAMLSGPTAIVTGKGEVTEIAKIVVDFAKKNEQASIKGADWDGKILDAATVEELSKIPGKDQMRAILLATFKEPAARLARVLKAKADKDPAAEAAPAAEAPAAEAPAQA
jgi:large subunit ribosomal protein L10